MLALQQGAGNAHVTRHLRALARVGDPARDAFVARGLMPTPAGVDFQSATGRGGFEVVYDPHAQILRVRLRVGFEFLPSLGVDRRHMAIPLTPDFAAAAADVNARFPSAGARRNEIRTNWRWSAGERATLAADYATMVRDAWGDQHYFVSDRWPDLYAGVSVEVDVHQGHLPDDHCKATVYKAPPGDQSMGAGMTSGAGATGATLEMSSAHMGVTEEWLNYSLEYQEGSDDLYASVSTSKEVAGDPGDMHLDKLIVDQAPGTPGGGAPITVTGRASTAGDARDNLRLSRRRAQGVADHLAANGIDRARITVVAEGEEGAGADASWQRVDIRIGGGEEQIKALHETGHRSGSTTSTPPRPAAWPRGRAAPA